MAVQGRLSRNRERNIWMAMEKTRKEKGKFERKRKGYKLCREDIEVTE